MKTKLFALLALCLLGALGTAAISIAQKKSQTTQGSTKKQVKALPSGGTVHGSATCSRKTHATGGGFEVVSGINPATGVGADTRPQNLFPTGNKTWKTGIAATNLTNRTNTRTYVRCEKNNFSRNVSAFSGEFPIAMGQAGSINLNCPARTRVVSGGFSVTPSYDSTEPINTTGNGVQISQNRRTKANQWRVTAVNFEDPSVTVKGYAVCEAKMGSALKQRSRLVGFGEESRALATAKCTKKEHVVSGGFLLSPEIPEGGSGVTPKAIVDASMPVGSRSWQNKLSSKTTPARSSLTTYAYCRANKLKR